MIQRPKVTLAWAQALDGSIAARKSERYRLSGDASMDLTHRLRAGHDAILVGLGTVIADNPKLSARRVLGPNPIPVVLDSELRIPLDSYLVQEASPRPVIFHAAEALLEEGLGLSELRQRRIQLQQRSCRVLSVGRLAQSLNLEEVLDSLGKMGVRSLMVEGGGRVLAAFLRQRLADRLVVTVTPLILGGYNPFCDSSPAFSLPCRLADPKIEVLDNDVVIDGRPCWDIQPSD